MGWANFIKMRLSQGEEVSFRPMGNSMSGKIESGQLVTVRPLNTDEQLKVGDIVICKVRNNDYLHLIKAIRGNPDQYLIGNNKGRINGWGSLKKYLRNFSKINLTNLSLFDTITMLVKLNLNLNLNKVVIIEGSNPLHPHHN